MALYGKTQYWDQRYCRNSQPFDWYQRFSNLKDVVINNIHKKQSSQVLVVGCGNSRLADQMVQQGYSNITNIDNSISCIKNMNEKYKQNQKITYMCMDVKHLQFQSKFFDGIIDKALFDCILCSQNSADSIQKMLSEISRVVKKNGVYIMISYEPPIRRLPYLQKSEYGWSVKVQKLTKQNIGSYSSNIFDQAQAKNCHYIYTCRKQY